MCIKISVFLWHVCVCVCLSAKEKKYVDFLENLFRFFAGTLAVITEHFSGFILFLKVSALVAS